MTIYLADLDSRIVDDIVEHDVQNDAIERREIAYDMLLDAFATIAGEEVNIKSSDRYIDLCSMAERAAIEWTERYASRPDRRVVFIKMFPLAEEIIATILPTPKTIDYAEVMSDAGSITEEDIERFQRSIDSSGYPDYWTSDQRVFALQNRYNPQVFINDPNYQVTAEDLAWINKIMEGYKETP